MIDWDLVPSGSDLNQIWYNKELFHKQTRFLFYSNLIFGTLSILTIGVGYTFVQGIENDTNQESLLICWNGSQWIPQGLWGTLFVMCHQMMILL